MSHRATIEQAAVSDDADGVRARTKRGFAAMDARRQREIASKGGRAAHENGTAHRFSSEEARDAGRRGGRKVSGDRAHMAEIGRAGGNAHARAIRERDSAGSSAVVISPAATEVDPPRH
jgi:general stress protein YciG